MAYRLLGRDSMSNPTANAEAQVRRAVNACRGCKGRKVKCSGSAPCLNCMQRGQSCIFDKTDRRILISERRLRDLERRATASHNQSPRRNNHSSSAAIVREDGEQRDQPPEGTRVFDIPTQDQGCTVNHGRETPLPEPDSLFGLPMEAQTEPEKEGAHNWHLFTRAFSQEMRQILDPLFSERSRISELESSASYVISWQGHEPLSELSALSLPPKDYIIYLLQVANFHLNANYVFFNYTDVLDELSRASSQTLQMASGVWRVRLLLVIALGKLCLEKGATNSGPPGVREFVQGVNTLPSNLVLSRDPLMTVETLCLLAIYAQAADMHSVAYLYTGQASRIARLWGLNKGGHFAGDGEPNKTTHAQALWWTVCVLDQRHSAAIGTTPDYLNQDQNGPLTSWDRSPDDSPNLALRFNLSVSTLLTRVMAVLSKHAGNDVIYISFMSSIVGELELLRKLGRQISNAQQLCHDRSLLTISRPVATLHLLYYHCIIVATKPVLVHLTKLYLHNDDYFASGNASSDLAFSIMQTSVNAASHSLNIISALHEQDLLETFLFFDLEITFLAALSLVLANIITPSITEPAFVEVANSVLEAMSYRGNVPATSLKDELDKICRLACSLPQSPGRNSRTSVQRQPATMLQDGRALNNAILDAIEVHDTTPQTNCEPNFLQAAALSTSTEVRQPPGSQEPPMPAQSSSRRPSPLPTGGSIPHSSEAYIGNTDIEENMFNNFGFDMVGMQWLDSLQ